MGQAEFPDQVIPIGKVTLGEHARKQMKQKQERDEEKMRILKAACALLNTGGGLIQIEPDNQDFDFQKHALGQDIQTALMNLVQPSSLEIFFYFLQQNGYFLIFVKSWCSATDQASLCSISTGLRKRSGTSVIEIPSQAVPEFLQEQRQKWGHDEPGVPDDNTVQEFYSRDSVSLNEEVPFGESMKVEFKDFSSEKSLVKLRERLPKYISSFANTQGGTLFVGIDDKRRVRGCTRHDNLEKHIEDICKKANQVHLSDCKNPKPWSVQHRIISVVDSDSKNLCVLAIKIPVFCCIVFENQPDSWQINNSQMCQMEAEDWLAKMVRADPVKSKGPICIISALDDQLNLCFTKHLSLSDAPPQCKPVFGVQDTHLAELQKRLFPVDKENVKIGPEPLYTQLLRMHPNLQKLTKEENGYPGALIFSKSWAVDIGREKKSGVVCDALLISKNSKPILYTCVEKRSPDLWEYAISTAFHLKQQLVNLGGYSGRLCVIPKLVNCETGALIPRKRKIEEITMEQCYPPCYNLPRMDEVESLLRALLICVMSFPSVLSCELGCEFLNLLTEEQFQFLKTHEHTNELTIHGLPGTGKTMLAAEKVKRIKNSSGCTNINILYICENAPLRDFMRRMDICRCETRKSFMSVQNDFTEIQHIIVDEGQNFRDENGDWYSKAVEIVRESGGVFWIFLDHFQQSHTTRSGLPNPKIKNEFYLDRVVRNS
ncbi:schlafen family member 13-like [Megalops cyprinoides]|uniref:schlafen family member 13-like n=1 Tax=Megalops cyprinoides TaxID=118141 RepID=UPI00186499C3|nr:schlafen family member 13-like [Megalops cyprinoides]